MTKSRLPAATKVERQKARAANRFAETSANALVQNALYAESLLFVNKIISKKNQPLKIQLSQSRVEQGVLVDAVHLTDSFVQFLILLSEIDSTLYITQFVRLEGKWKFYDCSAAYYNLERAQAEYKQRKRVFQGTRASVLRKMITAQENGKITSQGVTLRL